MARPKKKTASSPLPLDWQIPDNVTTHRVTNAVVQMKSIEEFVVSFFEERGPLIITEEDKTKAMKSKSVKALCVSRICITPDRLEAFAQVFKQQYELHQEALRANK